MRVLSPVSIKAADDHGATVTIEPGLNVIAHMGRAVNPSILVMEVRKGTGSLFFKWANVLLENGKTNGKVLLEKPETGRNCGTYCSAPDPCHDEPPNARTAR